MKEINGGLEERTEEEAERGRVAVRAAARCTEALVTRRTGYGEGYNTVLPRASKRSESDSSASVGFAGLSARPDDTDGKEEERKRERESERARP